MKIGMICHDGRGIYVRITVIQFDNVGFETLDGKYSSCLSKLHFRTLYPFIKTQKP